MREGQIYPFTGQGYGCTPAADIQTIGRKATVLTCMHVLEECVPTGQNTSELQFRAVCMKKSTFR